MRRTRLIVLALGLVASGGAAGFDSGTVSQSPSYRLSPTAIDAAGGRASSASSRAEGSAGQPSTIGASSSPHFVVQSGFWGFLGTTRVPVVLSVDKTISQIGSVDLTWSGNDAPYAVYRATDCAVVFSSPLVQTSNNAYTDGSAPTSGLACYNVLATVPSPVPPSSSP